MKYRSEFWDHSGLMPAGLDHLGPLLGTSAQRLLRLAARLADDFPPLRYFRPEAGGAVLGRAGDRLVTERRQAFLHVRPDYGLCDISLQQRDDVPERPRRHD